MPMSSKKPPVRLRVQLSGILTEAAYDQRRHSSQQGAQSSTLLPKVEVGGAGGVCSLKCEVGSAPAHHTNVQG